MSRKEVHAYVQIRRQDQNRTGSKLVPLERGEIPSYDSLRRILSELCKHVHFRRALPVIPEVFPTKVENTPPFDIYYNVMASPLTLRDLDYRNDRGQTLPPRLLLYQSMS
jgi:hypothetical protein